MTQFFPFDECSQAFIDEENNLWSYDGVEWHPRIGDPRMARKKKEQAEEIEVLEVLGADVYPDTVMRPKHYVEGRRYEPWDVIADYNLDFFLGNAFKYIARAGRKADIREDIQKAITYLQKKLELLK